MNAHDTDRRVSVELPADPDLWILARMSANALASRLDFSVEDLADLRLAVNELCRSCADGATAESRIRLAITWNDGSIEIRCRVDHLAPGRPLDSELAELVDGTSLGLSRRILDALVDRHEIGPALDGVREGWLCAARIPALQ